MLLILMCYFWWYRCIFSLNPILKFNKIGRWTVRIRPKRTKEKLFQPSSLHHAFMLGLTILGELGADSWGERQIKRAKLVQAPGFCSHRFRPFYLPLAPTFCPWSPRMGPAFFISESLTFLQKNSK